MDEIWGLESILFLQVYLCKWQLAHHRPQNQQCCSCCDKSLGTLCCKISQLIDEHKSRKDVRINLCLWKQCILPGQSSRLTVPKAWEIARTALIVFTTKGFWKRKKPNVHIAV